MKKAAAAPTVAEPKSRAAKTSKPKSSEAITKKASPTRHRKTATHAVSDPPQALEMPAVKHEQVAELAYYRWLARSGAPGNPEDDWLHAERQLAANA